jgi:hypothetical protein
MHRLCIYNILSSCYHLVLIPSTGWHHCYYILVNCCPVSYVQYSMVTFLLQSRNCYLLLNYLCYRYLSSRNLSLFLWNDVIWCFRVGWWRYHLRWQHLFVLKTSAKEVSDLRRSSILAFANPNVLIWKSANLDFLAIAGLCWMPHVWFWSTPFLS